MSSTVERKDLSLEEKRALLARLLEERASRSDSLPLSFAQQRLWFLDQLDPGSPVYNIPASIRVRGLLNAAALEQSFNEIVRRHEALRTTFAVVDGSSVQVIAPTMTVSLPIVDLSELTQTEREAQALRLATEEAQRPFDLTRGPLVRVSLLRLHDEDHILLLTMHHIVSDGWSVSVLFRELAALYEAFSTRKPSPLPELPIQYADFAVWQREWLQGGVLEEQLSYWKKQLSGAPAMLELPMDRPRPAVQTFQGARQSVLLPKSILKGLNELSRQEGVTLFMTLLAAFQTLLARYTNQEDIVVGSPIAYRNRAEIEGLIGFFVNTLVLRTDVSGDPSFRELLGRVREVALGAYAHQDMPFETLVEQLQPERSLSHAPLFQVMFVLQNAREELGLSNLTLSPLAVDNLTSKFDLTLFMWEESEGLRAVFEYNTDLSETATIKRMLAHFQTLLEGIVADPEQRLATLPLLTEVELKQLLVEWNDTQTDFPKDSCLHQLFEQQVERNPDAIAVLFKNQQTTYGELNRRANQLAHHLRSLGVGPDVWVGLCVERSLEMVIGILGILKAGGAYVPLDPAYPRERLAFMLEDARCSVLLTQHRLLAVLPSHRARVLCLDADWKTIARESPQNPQTAVKGEHLAYVIYTSGSTGRPKGIAIQHRGVVNNLVDLNRRFAVGHSDRVLALSSLSFDMCVYEMLGTLGAGAAIVLPEASVEREPAHWAELMARHHVSVWNSAPSLLEKLVEYVSERTQLRPRYLRLVLLGGDWVAVSLPDQLKALAPGVQVIVMGGATEASIHSIIYEVERTDPSWNSIPYGRPMANQRAYVLDAHLQPVPIGVPGELHLGGVGLARGYFKRPELTAERFIPNPFSKEPGERLYKTGDLARYLLDGNIELLGRMDFQVKIRGFRIELGEIEAVLGQHPAVRETVVMAREDEPGNKRLVAYVVANQEQTSSVSKLSLLKGKLQGYKVPEHLVAHGVINQKQVPSVSEMRSFLKEKLPEYMVPTAFVILEALPLTPGGKVDRRALPMPDHIRPELEKAFVAPRDMLELQLTKVWEKVLGTQPIGVSDNFFDLGGHSLLALRLFAQIEKVLGKNLPLATLFQAPTVEQLAGILRQQGWSPSWSSLVPIQPGGSKPPFFCAHAAGGSVLFYRDLARRLGPDQPFYGFQPRRLNGKYAPHTRVEDMAAHYIKEMRNIQPEGPYFLGGSSLGGTVVFEMAQQLHAQGQKVALVALFDTWGPGYGKVLLDTSSFNWKVGLIGRRVEHHLESLLMLKPKDKLTYLWQKTIKVRNQIKRSVKNRRKAITRKLYLAIGRPLPGALRETQNALSQANRSYVPQTYPGRVTLFRASKQPPGIYPDPTLGWDGLAAEGLEIHEVPGTHGALVVEPRVQFLVEKLRICLDKAQATDSGEQILSLDMAAAMHSRSIYPTQTV